jgi:hypothetical protein
MRGEQKQMDKARIKAAIIRFVRGFVAAGVAACAVAISNGVQVASFEDLQKLAGLLLYAFISGGLLGLDKLIRGEDKSGEIILK